jgi:TorA maturation chaperone TorD
MPDSEWMKTFPPLAGALREECRPLRQFSFWGEWEKTLDLLDEFSEDAHRAMESFYVNYMMVTGSSDVCSPYESFYVSREEVAVLISNLDGQYAEDGFVLPSSTYQTPDHVSVQLEFMSMQCGLEARAWEEEASEDALSRLKREVSFLNEYLLRWFPVFADRLGQMHPKTLYAQAARTGYAFLVHDKDLIASLLEKFREGVKG